jgi:hypothetical protein
VREITYDIATRYKNGYYNPSIDWGLIGESLNWLSRYKQIKFRRVTAGGRIHFVQANTQPNPNWMMWTSGWTCNVSPVRNFGKNPFQSAKYWLHEFAHMVRGGTTHLKGNEALMSDLGGTCCNITEPDYEYFAPYAWKPSVKLPHLEPNAMVEKFTSRAMMNASDARLKSVHRAILADHLLTAEVELSLPRQCKFLQRNWSQTLGRVP